jgi:hypothetical protein
MLAFRKDQGGETGEGAAHFSLMEIRCTFFLPRLI